MSDDQKPSDDVMRAAHNLAEPLDPVARKKLNDLKMALARIIQQHDAQPETAITAMLNLMGSIIGTWMDDHDRQKWIQQCLIMIPAYVESYRVREKRIDR